MSASGWLRTTEARLVAPGRAADLAWVRTVLVLGIALRLAIEPYHRFADQPDALWFGAFAVRWLGSMPPLWAIVGLQALGLAAALACAAQVAPRRTFAVAWLGLLVLGGLRGSAGKIVHNDVLMLLACVPVLFAPADALRRSVVSGIRYGWPRRGALVVVAVVYFATGVQKLRHSGIDWVMSGNLRWVLYSGAADHPPAAGLARFVADRPWMATASGILFLGFELGAPILALWSRRSRWGLLAGSVALHTSIWLALGLHYWGWVITVAALVVPWDVACARAGSLVRSADPELA